MDTPTSPIDRLRSCGALWAEAHGATLARLGRIVVNDGGFFTRLEKPGASTTTLTLEKFARYFLDPLNWAGGQVPETAYVFAHVMGVYVEHATGSPDSPSAGIGAGSPPEAGFPPVASAPGETSTAADSARAAAVEEPFALTAPEARVA